jgi:4-hydroxybenzoate polyprenyltransferase
MRVLPYAQLLRVPNTPTALADVCLGAFATGAFQSRPGAVLLLLAATACLYSAGMALNDLFDLEEDRRERPGRPLPSGRVRPRTAALLGGGLIVMGWGLAAASGWGPEGFHSGPGLVAGLLVAAILVYDSGLKRSTLGPLGMGTCRFLNVLLGLAADPDSAWRPVQPLAWPVQLHLAAVVGIYIVGVTWFARSEARSSDPAALRGAGFVMLTAGVLALAIPVHFPPGRTWWLFPYLLVAFGFYVGPRVRDAIEKPTAERVQAAVKRSIFGLVVFDAVLATIFVGPVGLLILLLLPPAIVLGKWVYST